MTPVCPFAEASLQDDGFLKQSGHTTEHGSSATTEYVNSLGDEPRCPFGYDSQSSKNPHGNNVEDQSKSETECINCTKIELKCPFGYDSHSKNQHVDNVEDGSNVSAESVNSAKIEPKCPFGYDAQSFKLGPFSCMICQSLLFQCSRCMPCSHVYCRTCISRFEDCPLCGADIENIEYDEELQKVVDKVIDGRARINRSQVSPDGQEEVNESRKHVIYEDVSLERGAFLLQQAMRAFQAQNFESAKSRLSLCAADMREQLDDSGNKPELCSQLGAVLGTLGDCCHAMGDAASAITYFEESVELLSRFPADDMELVHTLSVSLNKIGDLKYSGEDLQAARSYYSRSLDVRRGAMKSHCKSPAQTLDVAVSLGKVADVNRGLGYEAEAIAGFHEAMDLLESLNIKSDELSLEKRRQSVLEFLSSQVAETTQ